MARSLGGGGGGGSRSFGGHSSGGSRSFGGSHLGGSSTRHLSSSSHRSSSSYHSSGWNRRSGSSFHVGGGMPPPPPSRGYRGGYRYNRGPVYVGGRSGGGGCGTGCGTVFLVTLLIALIGAFAGVFTRYNNQTTDNYGSYNTTGNSNTGYGCEKYTGEVDTSHGYWADDSTGSEKWIDSSNSRYLEDGFSTFYNKTGVYPFLYVVDKQGDKGSFDTYEERVYDDLFGDCPGNLLFVFVSDEESYYIAAGVGTGSVINDKTVPYVIQSRITSNWKSSNYDGDLAKIFGSAMSSSATQLMKEVETTKLASKNFKTIMIVLIAGATVVIVLLIVIRFWKKKKQVQKEEDERLEKILSQPLSTFGDQAIQDLGKKYDSGNAVPLSSVSNTNYYSEKTDNNSNGSGTTSQ